MPDAGDIWLADAGLETRRELVVVSDRRFHEFAQRALVAPITPSPEIRYPWFVDLGDGRSAAVHHLRSIAVDRLLDHRSRADLPVVIALRRAVRQIAAV